MIFSRQGRGGKKTFIMLLFRFFILLLFIMAEKKNQHYVPRFYLKLFSPSEHGKTIDLFQKRLKKIVRNAKLKKQASEDYFYSKDLTIEENLSHLEGAAAEIFKQISLTNKLPEFGTMEYFLLIVTTILQSSRTKKHANEMNEMTDKLAKTQLKYTLEYDKKFVRENPLIKEIKLNEVKIIDKNASLMSISTAMDLLPSILDLGSVILVNKTKTPFITSDNPVVKYNQFLEKKKYNFGTTGFGSLGLQFFYPITPSLMIILYDKWIYKIDSKFITDSSIVDKFNLLQILNSNEVAYFNNNISDDYIIKLFKKSEKFCDNSDESFTTTTYKKIDPKIHEIPDVIGFQKKEIKVKFEVPFIVEKPHTKSLMINFPAIRKTTVNLKWMDFKKGVMDLRKNNNKPS